jgi:hypothetical protein
MIGFTYGGDGKSRFQLPDRPDPDPNPDGEHWYICYAGVMPPPPPGGPVVPETKADCKDGGYEAFGFKNQGSCVAHVNSQAKASG